MTFQELPDDGEALTLEGPMALQEFMIEIGGSTGWNVLVSEAAEGVQLKYFNIFDVRPKDAMEVIRFNGGLYYEYKPETNYLYLMTKDEYLTREFGAAKPHEFQVNHANMEYLTTALTALKSQNGRLIVDSRTRRI